MQKNIAALLLLAALSVFLYARTAGYPFVFDDSHTITENPAIRDLSHIPKLFAGPGMEGGYDKSGSYRPLLFTTYAINYRMGGLNPAPYHWTGILLHIINCFLVFLLVQKLAAVPGRDPWPWSLIAAGVFCLHPVQTETVIYTAARSTLLSTTFCLAGVLSYFSFRAGRKTAMLPIAVLFYAFALLTKETTLPFVAVFFLMEAWLYRDSPEKSFSWKGVVPFAFVSASYFVFRIYLLKGSSAKLPEWGFVTHWFTELSVLPRYLKLIILPYGLTVDHHVPLVTRASDPGLIAGALILAAAAYFAFRFYRTDGLVTVLIAWPFAALATEIVFPLADLLVEYRLYPALAGVVSLAAVAMSRIEARNPRRAGLVLAACLLVVLGALSLDRQEAWSSDIALWKDAVAKTPAIARPYNNLGSALDEAGDYAAAEGYLLKAVEIRPDYVDAYASLGRAYEGLKQYDKAASVYRKAIELDPKWLKGYLDYGAFLGMRGDYAGAEEMMKKALALNPASDDAYTNLGNVYSCTGKLEDSLRMYRKAVELNGSNFEARVNAGFSLAELKRYEEAFDAFSGAARLFPDKTGDISGGVAALRNAGQAELASRLEQEIGPTPR